MNADKIYAQKIALEYSKLQSRKAKALKRLDKWVKKPAKITSFIIGLLSLMIFVLGLIFSLKPLLLIAVIGFIFNPFVYFIILNKRKKENANDVLLLAQDVIDE